MEKGRHSIHSMIHFLFQQPMRACNPNKKKVQIVKECLVDKCLEQSTLVWGTIELDWEYLSREPGQWSTEMRPWKKHYSKPGSKEKPMKEQNNKAENLVH
ncbi:hypothetical protein OIU79_023891 [Salix purpurea]|uniref:Uncharacterized protein n=1 Tax=Salix purpurea TaxID=77065 RepID=A0A9Q0WAX8_SALPP|nr:hypothetical protein OIU79_023891 [Salix purpurea]